MITGVQVLIQPYACVQNLAPIKVAVLEVTIERDLSRIKKAKLHNRLSEMRVFQTSAEHLIFLCLLRRLADEFHLFY